ncbi:MAG: VWA domain-containing protein [Clostridia bacterium]|nr:VWA domain-containing protein [Clostridia bacterium]
MRFLYPLGLLGLIGIPILIIIYIIKNKHTEQTISSTYLWRLSERFLKRKNPISKIKGLISLILQCLTVFLISFAIAHPVLVLKGQAYEYCFILDGSGSMQMTQEDGTTRFDAAKEKIKDIISDSKDGSLYSIYYAGDTTMTAVVQTEDKSDARAELERLTCAYTPDSVSDVIEKAQELFNKNPGLKTYLVTDKEYEKHDNIEIINVAANEENYSVSDLSFAYVDGKVSVMGKVISYTTDVALTVDVYAGETLIAEKEVQATKGEETVFTAEALTESVSYVRAKIRNADANAIDNERAVYNMESEDAYKVLLVSKQPFFLKTAISTLGYTDIEVMNPSKYDGQNGYGLYIFDSCNPGSVPSDGAVWFLNLSSNLEGAGFTAQGEVELKEDGVLTYTDSTATTVEKLLTDVTKQDITVKKFQRYGVRNVTTLLSYKGNPLLFVTTTEYGARQVVFAFDVHDSNLPLQLDFIPLMRNLLEYSFPPMTDKVSYVCGENLSVNVLPGCTSIKVETPSQNLVYLNTNAVTSEMLLDEVGVYTVKMTISGSEKVFHAYSALPKEESEPLGTAKDEYSLNGQASSKGMDGKYDNLFLVFIGLGIIFLADWAVYCYDKYQLR